MLVSNDGGGERSIDHRVPLRDPTASFPAR
jgi:hypothetical protein